MAALTYWNGYQVAFVPPGTVAERGVRIVGYEGPRDVLIAPEGQPLPKATDSDELKQPQMRLAPSNSLGIIWALTLCLVIAITHVKLRGIWSLMVLVVLVFTSILFALVGLWDPILRSFQVIDIHITAFSYLSISFFLFVIWLLAFLLFDRLVYMVFTRGQLRVRMAVGDGESVFDTRGMLVEKHQDDLFRHWLLGFGSGDLTVRTSGTNPRLFEMPNVLGVGRKLALIHTMLQDREVVRGSR
jgi:FlaA1/EpsC-like NDP-sugar epimerase